MANAWYPKTQSDFAKKLIDWTSDDIRVMLVKSGYAYSTSHHYVSDVVTYDNGRSAQLAAPSVADGGVLSASSTSLTATAASACNALIVYKNTGSDATSPVLAYIDTPSAGLPFTPAAGQTVSITWNASGIAQL